MWSNIIFVIATLCVVNASVIKVYDEREEPVVDEAAEDCDWRACDQLCRNMGFPSGVCIRGRCKCDNFKNAEEELQSPVKPEEPVALRSCNPMECDQRCRRLKFPGGVCVNGRCKCDNFRSAQDFASLIESYSSPRSCNPQECDQRCRRLKFPGGVCVNGRCKCDNFRSADDAEVLSADSTLEEVVSPLKKYKCRHDCNDFCRFHLYSRGKCDTSIGECKCYKSRRRGLLMSALEQPNEDVGITNDETEQSNLIPEESFADFASLIESYSSPRSCNPQECNQRCQRLKFPGGVCVNGRCKCDNFRSADDTEIEYATLDARFSPSVKCSRKYSCQALCRLWHIKYGTCRDGKCVCFNGKNRAFIALPVAEPEEEIDTTNDEVEESNLILDQDENLEGEEYLHTCCNPQECDQRCRRLKFPGGVCVNGRCKCDNFRSADDVNLNSGDINALGCNYRICNDRCRQLGYAGAICYNNHCQCRKVQNFKAESDVEESALPRWGNCDYLDCQRQCFKIGYYGTCVTGRCECMKPYAMSTVLNVEDRAGPQTCDFAKCQQSCNAIGYRARCVGKRCECISRAAASAEFNLEEPVAPQTCDFARCQQSCNAIGYRARCVGKRCECISRAAANTEFSLEEPTAPQSCNFIQCNQQCNRIGFRGQCLNGRCQCVGRAATNTEFNLEEPAAPQTCDFTRCYQSCSAIGYRARCVGKRCECISRAAANTEFSLEEPTSPQSCNFIQCNQQCNRIGFRGQCLNGRCQCVGRAAANSDLEPEQASASSCYREECKRHCNKLGYLGQCLAGRCKCYTKDLKPMYPQKDTETDAAYSGSDIEEYARLRNCKPELCSLICRFLRYKNGTCVNGRCQCNNDEDSQNNTTPKPVQERNDESTSKDVLTNEIDDSSQVLNEKVEDANVQLENLSVSSRSCNFYECEKYCSRRGFRPVCSNGRCKCYTNKSAKMIAEDDTTTNEVEESNQMPNAEEEGEDHYERAVRRACYQYECNDRCLRTGYTGGLCRKNKCKCY